MIKNAIISVTKNENLSFETAEQVMNQIMRGEASPVQISAYLTSLSMKGETVDEITGSAKSMRNHCTKLNYDGDILEIVGTGGDKSNSFNISTTCAIVLAGAGITVGKHGNRASSSKCGSADVLEALGVNIDISPEKSLETLEKIGICFLFAQRYHTAMKYVAPVRRELSIRTIFNILGPLSNPLGANMQLMGVYDEKLIEPLADVLINLGVKSGMVVYGTDGLDEISMSAETKVCEIRNGSKKSYIINPVDFGFNLCTKEDLVGGMPEENADITRKILEGEKSPRRDAVVLNSAVSLYIAKDNLTIKEAIENIEEIIDSKKALEKLEEFIKITNE